MMYTATLDNTKVTVSADSMREAELQILCAYGVDAIGMGISGEKGDFLMTACKEAWQRDLDNYFHGFTMDDVYRHCLMVAFAWVNFPTETTKEWDYSTGEKYDCTRLGAEGKAYLKAHDRLGNYMEQIGWRD